MVLNRSIGNGIGISNTVMYRPISDSIGRNLLKYLYWGAKVPIHINLYLKPCSLSSLPYKEYPICNELPKDVFGSSICQGIYRGKGNCKRKGEYNGLKISLLFFLIPSQSIIQTQSKKGAKGPKVYQIHTIFSFID